MLLRVYLSILLIMVVSCSEIDKEHAANQILEKLTNLSLYDKRIKPSNASEPLIIEFNAYVLSINNVDENKELFQIQVYFRQFWKDQRLKFDDKDGKIPYLNMYSDDLIWVPDTFFTNEHKSYYHEITEPNMFIEIAGDGSVRYSRRITITLHCPMDFTSFPFDTQVCNWKIGSYAYTSDRLLLKWKSETPVEVANTLHLPLHVLENIGASEKPGMAKYSELIVKFVFKRQIEYYLINVFIPCAFMVIVSWTAFWINSNKLTTRILIGAGALYTSVMQVWRISDELPKVSYTKIIDIYTGISLSFIFVALLETITVHFKTIDSGKECDSESSKNYSDKEAILGKQEKYAFFKKWIIDHSGKSLKMDVAARIVFPLLYLVFNIIFWSIGLCP